jgi:intracellular multiplication protein IcmV
VGFLSGTKKVAGHIVNVRADKWFNYENHKFNVNYIISATKNLFLTEKTENQETFEQAVARLQLTEQDLLDRKKEFFRLFIISLIISIGLFCYTMFITINYQNLYGFILGMAVTVLGLSKTFKYHFWLTQITKKKLGLTFKDWLN